MSIESLLNEEIFKIPKINYNNKYFPNFVKSFLKDYSNVLSKYEDKLMEELKIKGICKEVNEIRYKLEKSIDEYYKGHSGDSFVEFKSAIDLIKDQFNGLYIEEQEQNLFRMRIGNNKLYQAKEMFHVPFELRGRVNSYRFSIPGFPCLYAGGSLYLCWEEMGRPDINTTQSALIRIKDKNFEKKILNFSMTSKYWLDKLNNPDECLNKKGLESFLKVFPFVALSHIKVNNDKDIFKPEYIFPQMLLQWIHLSKSYKGIRYLSTKIDLDTEYNYKTISKYFNYIFPVEKPKQKGICSELKKKIEITNPISWQIFQLSTKTHDKENGNVTKIKIGDLVFEYENTDFFRLEEELKNQKKICL